MGTLRVPEAARPAWDALTLALLDYEPPCASQPDLWWDTAPAAVEAAIYGCQRCQVLPLCAAYATAAGERHGVWAGRDREPRRPADPGVTPLGDLPPSPSSPPPSPPPSSPPPSPNRFFGEKKYSTVRISEHLPLRKTTNVRSHCDRSA